MLVNVTVAVVAVLTVDAVEVTAAFISWAAQTARLQASANKTELVLMGDGCVVLRVYRSTVTEKRNRTWQQP